MWYVHYLHAQEVMEESMRTAMRANLLRAVEHNDIQVSGRAPNEIRRLAARVAIGISEAAARAAHALDSKVVTTR